MQTVIENKQLTKVHENRLSGYELTQLITRNGKRLNLKPRELLVLTALSTYYNANNPSRVVFPSIKTLAENINMSKRTIIIAINNLVSMGFIFRSKKNNSNSNLYAINTNRLESASPRCKICTKGGAESAPPMILTNNMEQIKNKQQQKEKKVVVVDKKISSFKSKPKTITNSFSPLNTSNIPKCLHDKAKQGKIKNLLAYWNSLTAEAKQQYTTLDQQNFEKQKALEERKKQEERERLKRLQEMKEARTAPPFYVQMTRDEAINHLMLYINSPVLSYTLKNKNSLPCKIAEYHGIDIDGLINHHLDN